MDSQNFCKPPTRFVVVKTDSPNIYKRFAEVKRDSPNFYKPLHALQKSKRTLRNSTSLLLRAFRS